MQCEGARVALAGEHRTSSRFVFGARLSYRERALAANEAARTPTGTSLSEGRALGRACTCTRSSSVLCGCTVAVTSIPARRAH